MTWLVTSATEKCTNQCLIVILGDHFDDVRTIRWSKVARKSTLFCVTFKSVMEFTVPLYRFSSPRDDIAFRFCLTSILHYWSKSRLGWVSRENVWGFLQPVSMGYDMPFILLNSVETLEENCTLNMMLTYCRISLAYMLVGCFLCFAGGQMSIVVSDVVGKLQQVLQGYGGRLTSWCICFLLLCSFLF